MSRLFHKYKSDVIQALITKFNYKNVMQVPKLDKIVINMACGEAVSNDIIYLRRDMYDFQR